MDAKQMDVKQMDAKQTTPWSRPDEGEKKAVEISANAMRIISKFAAKRGMMREGNGPGDVIEAILLHYRVEETS